MALKIKSLLLFSVLIGCIALLPIAQAQLNGLGGILGPLLNILRVQGILYCTPNGNVGTNATATPTFPNALVQLQCGGNVVSSSTTDNSGQFSMILDPVSLLFSTLLSGCKLAVNTPLASCNASLPSVGSLVSELQFVGSTLTGLLSVANVIPTGFRFSAN